LNPALKRIACSPKVKHEVEKQLKHIMENYTRLLAYMAVYSSCTRLGGKDFGSSELLLFGNTQNAVQHYSIHHYSSTISLTLVGPLALSFAACGIAGHSFDFWNNSSFKLQTEKFSSSLQGLSMVGAP
jgi:hypothetical protein